MDRLLQFLHRDTLDWSAVQSKSHRLLQFSFLPSSLPAWPTFSLSPGGKEGKLQQTVGFWLNSWSIQCVTMEKLQQTVKPSPMPFFSLTDPSWVLLSALTMEEKRGEQSNWIFEQARLGFSRKKFHEWMKQYLSHDEDDGTEFSCSHCDGRNNYIKQGRVSVRWRWDTLTSL